MITSSGMIVRVVAMIDAVAQHVSPWLYLEMVRSGVTRATGGAGGAIVSWAIAAGAVALAVTLVASLPRQARARAWSALGIWTAAFVLLAAIYVVFFDSSHFYTRYTAPLVVVSIPLLARALAPLSSRVAGTAGTAVFAGALLAAFAVTAAATLHAGRIGNPHSISAGFVARALPRAERVGAFQSGVVGYFNENVINLDGKVNAGALVGNGGMERYIDEACIRYLVDWPGVMRPKIDGEWLDRQWRPCDAAVPAGISVCLARKSD